MRPRFRGVAPLLLLSGLLLAPPSARAIDRGDVGQGTLSSQAATRATGISGPSIGSTPTSLVFGSVVVGQTATRDLTVFNDGYEPLTLVSASISDGRFTSTFAGPVGISVGGSHTFSVSYRPTSATSDDASLTLSSNATNDPLVVPMSGTGVTGSIIGAGGVLLAPSGQAAGDQFGISVSSAGDWNSDGIGDVIVGAWSSDAGGGDAGRAYIYLGAIVPSETSSLILQGASIGNNFGTSVASAGDVNGDGHADVIVGAWKAGPSGAGRAYVYFGGPGADAAADLVLTGEATGDRFGGSVSAAGDVNDDGYGDVVVGASGNDTGGIDVGRAYVYFGGPTPNGTADWILTGQAASDNFGWSVADAGDVNGDGFGDLVVGAYGNDAGGEDAGRAYVYLGGNVPDVDPDWILTGNAEGDRFGVDVACAGDVNGDGRSDVIVGADNAGVTRVGRAYVFFGDTSPRTSPDLTLTGEFAGGLFGESVSSAGDVDADGYDDLLVGAPAATNGVGVPTGRAFLYHGGPIPDTIADAAFTGEGNGDRLGISVASAGDVNGDGHDDVMMGAYFNDNYLVDSGRAYVMSLVTGNAPVVTAPASTSVTAGSPISFQVTATDPDGGPILSLTAAPLPVGAGFVTTPDRTSGTFTWSPVAQQVGSWTITFRASNGIIGVASTTIVVRAANRPPTLSAPASVVAAEGVFISFDVSALDLDGDQVTLGVNNRPVGSLFVDFGSGGGRFSWTPGYGQAGVYAVSFTARDALGGEAVPKSVTITVDNVNREPTAAPGGPYAGVVGVPIVFVGTGSSDPDGDALSYLWDYGDLATGSGPNPQHAFAAGGVFTVSLTVGDGVLSDAATTTATVQDVFPATAFQEGGNKTTRLNSGKAQMCVQIEPVDRSYLNTSVSIATVVMISNGTGSVDRISALSDKTSITGDRDHNGIDEITACFAKTDLRNLFDGLSGGRHTVGVTLEGDLTTGGRFRGTLEMDVVASGNALAASVSPNPLNPAAVLTFHTTRPGPVAVSIFDLSGRLVRTVLSEPFLSAGYHDAPIDGRRDDGTKLASGVYFFRVEAAEGNAAGRIVLLK